MILRTLALFQGVTFRVEGGELVIARILHGSMIDRQGMMHTGDVIREVNGQEVGSDPKELQELLKDSSGSITLKVSPSYRKTPTPPQVRERVGVYRYLCNCSAIETIKTCWIVKPA